MPHSWLQTYPPLTACRTPVTGYGSMPAAFRCTACGLEAERLRDLLAHEFAPRLTDLPDGECPGEERQAPTTVDTATGILGA